MRIGNDTISVLKNFSEINPSILFQEGNTLKTISPRKNIIAVAKVEDSFDGEAAVYDLSRFISVLNLFDEPELVFNDEKFTIKSGKSKVNYYYASKNMIVLPPEKNIEVKNPDAVFNISWDDLQGAIKASGILQLEELCFKSDGKKIIMSVENEENPTSDHYSVEVADADGGEPFSMTIKGINLRLLPGDYKVTLSSAGVAVFESERVTYWVALEAEKND